MTDAVLAPTVFVGDIQILAFFVIIAVTQAIRIGYVQMPEVEAGAKMRTDCQHFATAHIQWVNSQRVAGDAINSEIVDCCRAKGGKQSD